MNRPFNRYFSVLNGNVMTSGNSLNLAKGQLGLFDVAKQSKDGLAAVSSITGANKSSKFQLKLGVHPLEIARTQGNKADSTPTFKVSDIKSVRVSAPKTTEQKVDEVILGYDGLNDSTAITFKKGDRKAIFIELLGEQIGALGYPDNRVTIEYVMEADKCNPLDTCVDCDNCDEVDCAPIILQVVEFLNDFKLRGDVPLTDVIEINPVKSCATDPDYTETEYSFYTLEVTDGGDDNALALVQAQYPSYVVVKTNRVGTTSTYQILAPAGLTLADYSQSLASILKGCEDCPASYTEVPGGILYAVSLSDAGVDESGTVDGLPGYVTGTVAKHGQDGSVGFYTAVVDDELTAAEISTFVTANPTAVVTKVGPVSTVCENTTLTEYEWVEGDSCNVSTERYEITLPDTDCGETILTELQNYYPALTVIVKGNSYRNVNLTGTSGTANIAINGTNYLATFSSSLTTTATNFVTAHAATILTAHGITVTANTGVLKFKGDTMNFPTITITNATGDLAGTIGALTAENTVAGACQTTYQALAITNMVCDECDPMFKKVYVSEAPGSYNGKQWSKVAATPAYTDCKCGIKFKAKEFFSYPSEVFRDSVGFTESSVRINVSGGYITEQREGVGSIVDEPMNVQYLSRWTPRTHLGGNLWNLEATGNRHFKGVDPHEDLVTRALLGESSVLEANKQYAVYQIEFNQAFYMNGNGQKHQENTKYNIIVEFGRHSGVESIVNMLAGAAGIPGVTA